MKKFLKNALESAYILYENPAHDKEAILKNLKFFFPLPLCLMFAGISIHLILDFSVVNKFFTESPVWVKVLFGFLISGLAYPFYMKVIFPLLVIEDIDRSKKGKYVDLIIYWVGCFVLTAIIGWISNFTRADEFRQPF